MAAPSFEFKLEQPAITAPTRLLALLVGGGLLPSVTWWAGPHVNTASHVVAGLFLLLSVMGTLSILFPYVMGVTRATILTASPPTLTTYYGWRGRSYLKNRVELGPLLWVRARQADDEFPGIQVELSNRGQVCTVIATMPFTKTGLSAAENLCKVLADGLQIENKGYFKYSALPAA